MESALKGFVRVKTPSLNSKSQFKILQYASFYILYFCFAIH